MRFAASRKWVAERDDIHNGPDPSVARDNYLRQLQAEAEFRMHMAHDEAAGG